MAKLIVANWKMNGSFTKIEEDLRTYLQNTTTNANNVVFALPNVYLGLVKCLEIDAGFKLCSQDISKFDNVGAYTGEVSGAMLKDLGIDYAIVGHSERRIYFNEDEDILIKKVNNAINNKITPIYCIGESISVRKSKNYKDFLLNQLELLTKTNVIAKEEIKLVIAYEPIWAIGSGVVPSTEEIVEVINFINAFVQKYLPHAKITALYGGSVSKINAKEILNLPQVDGVLVGGASLLIPDFTSICSYKI
ncbi:MAG TPA: triose-phosphate isomerase [Burkholderiales bacterium]|nr:triose-phosphate isomerase [Burkholderiales bacterium]